MKLVFIVLLLRDLGFRREHSAHSPNPVTTERVGASGVPRRKMQPEAECAFGFKWKSSET
jgi:hypothetical protein